MSAPTSTLIVSIQPRISGSCEGSEIIWRYAGQVLHHHITCGGGKLRSLRHDLASAFNQIHGHKGAKRNMQMARANLRAVLKRAHSIGLQFFTGAPLPDLLNFWLRNIEGDFVDWQIEAPQASMFALDMLPLGWLKLSKKEFHEYLTEHPDLTTSELASMLPCWQWPVIRRFLEMDQSPPRSLRHGKRVRVAFVADAAPDCVKESLRAAGEKAHKQMKGDQNIGACYLIERPWPDDETSTTDDLISALARHLMNPDYMPRGCHYPDDPAAVTHFFCHGRTSLERQNHQRNQSRGWEFELQLGQRSKQDGHHQITASALREHLEIEQAKLNGEQNKPLSLIFMNACGSATQSCADDVALASVFLSKRHPSVIAAEAAVDAATARRISCHFYERFLRRVPAHVALWEALRRLICEEISQNRPHPAALLYSCYGSPYCRLNLENDLSQERNSVVDSQKRRSLLFPPD